MTKDEELKKIVRSFFPGTALVFLILLIHFYTISSGDRLLTYGLFPRSPGDLTGILTFPFIHRDTEHVLSNVIPLFILTAMLFYFYRVVAWRVLLLTWLLSGFWLWLGGRPSAHIGASGLVYGLASFLFFSGVWRRERRMMAVSLTVVFLYGGMVWGILPLFRDVSWEGHLFGGLSGLLLSWIYRKEGPQRIVYDWEKEPEEEAEAEEAVPADQLDTTTDGAAPLPLSDQQPPATGPLFNMEPPRIRFDYIEQKPEAPGDEEKT